MRRTPAVRAPGPLDQFRSHISPWAILIGVLFVCVTGAVIVLGGQVMPWGLGQKPRQDIRVRAPFQVLDPQATELKREQARQSTPNYYTLNRTFPRADRPGPDALLHRPEGGAAARQPHAGEEAGL